MNIRFFKYPWQVAFEDLSAKDVSELEVASGACCYASNGSTFDPPFPTVRLNEQNRELRVYELPDTDLTERLSRFSYDGKSLHASKYAYSGLSIGPSEGHSDLSTLIEESLVYIQRLEDIMSESHYGNIGSVKRVPWDVTIKSLSETDWNGDMARKPLIVSIAEEQMYPLREISRGAKRILRRHRATVRISKAREFDTGCLTRIAQLPGRTIPEKAGPKQRIPAVERFESTDTLENRVVEHFCRLSALEWRRTQDKWASSVSKDWRSMANSFVQLCGRVRNSDDFSRVTKLRSPCVSPNFTLEQNNNYRGVWKGYRRLIRRDQEREECWIWARRVFLNRALVFASELFDKMFSSSLYIPYKKNLRVTGGNKHGLWIDPRSLPGPRVVDSPEKAGHCTAYILSQSDLAAGFGKDSELLKCNADCYFLIAKESRFTVAPVYAFVGSDNNSAISDAALDLEKTFEELDTIKGGDRRISLTPPLLIWADFLDGHGIQSENRYIFNEGIPAINDTWTSPSDSLVSGLREALTS